LAITKPISAFFYGEIWLLGQNIYRTILPDKTKNLYKKGDSFQVEPNVDFTAIAKEPVSYLCIYG